MDIRQAKTYFLVFPILQTKKEFHYSSGYFDMLTKQITSMALLLCS